MDYNVHRRRTGLILGLALGGGYSLTANLINHLALPGIPLYVPSPGTLGLIVVTTLMFGVLGLIAAVVLPLVWELRTKDLFVRRWIPICSALVALLGGYWFVRRVWPG